MLNGFLNASPNAVVKSAAKSNFGNSLFHHFLISREYLFCRKKPSAVQLCLFDNFKKNAKYYYLIDRALVNNLKEPVFSTTTEAVWLSEAVPLRMAQSWPWVSQIAVKKKKKKKLCQTSNI